MSAVLAAVALGTTVTALAPPRQATLAAWAPVRDLPAGYVLRAEDLREVRLPAPDGTTGAGSSSSPSVPAGTPGAVDSGGRSAITEGPSPGAATGSAAGPATDTPAGAAAPRPGAAATLVGPEAVGSRLAVPWPAGVPLHSGALAGSTLLRQLAVGEVAVPLSWEDAAAAALLNAGDLVDVVVSTPEESGPPSSLVLARDARVLWTSPASEGGDGGWLGQRQREGATVVLAVSRSSAAAVSAAPQRGAVSLVLTG